MYKSIIKFIDYLEGELKTREKEEIYVPVSINSIERKIIKRKRNEKKADIFSLQLLIKAFKNPSHKKEYFTFSNLIKELKNCNLEKEIQLDILLYVIKKNIDLGLLQESQDIFIYSIGDLYKEVCGIVEDKVFVSFIDNEKLNEIVNASDDELSVDEQRMKKTLIKLKNTNQGLITVHRNLKKHYFDKLEEFNDLDLKYVLVSLQKLGIDKSTSEEFSTILWTKKQEYIRLNKQKGKECQSPKQVVVPEKR